MTDLLAATADLVGIASLSHDEGVIADVVEAALRPCDWLSVDRIGDNVVARTSLGHSQRLVLAGHLDTVPPVGNAEPKVEGDTLWGVGSSDMKGGLAVMLDLATTTPDPSVDLTWCFYAREEIGRAESGLLELWTDHAELLAGDAAILGEPTCALVEAGCQGTMRIRVTLAGVRAHTARPFTGRNAIHRLAHRSSQTVAGSGRAAPSSSTAAPMPSNCRSWRWTGEWRPMSSPIRRASPSTSATPRTAGPAEAEAYLRRAARLAARSTRTPGRRAGWSSTPPTAHRRRWTHPLPGRAAGGEAPGDRAHGQGGLDGRGVLLGARRPRGQLRPGRSTAGPSPRRACAPGQQLERKRQVLEKRLIA